jgi:trigger factor
MMKLRYRKLSVLLAAGLTASLLASTPGFAEGLESVQESQVEEAQEEGQEEEQEEYSEEEGPEETQEEETQEETQEAETPEEEYQEDEYYTDIDDADTEYDGAYYEDDSSTVESNVESAVEYTTNTTTGTTTSSDTTTTTTTTSGETTQSGTTSDAAAQSTANTTTQSSTTDAATQSTAPVEEEPKRPEYQALDYITLGDYKGLVVEVDPIEITDEDIDERIAQEIRYSEEGTDTLTEGTVEEGDIANIDFEGKKDGVAFDGGTAEGYDLEIGSGSFIDGFEDGLIGVAIGDTVDLDLTFPENYGNEDLAGQDVVFTVTVNSIDRVKELDDELASLLSDGEATTVDEYREYIKGILEEEALEERKSQVEMDLLTQAAENITVDTYPQDLVDYEIDQLKDYYQYYATIYGMDLGTLLSSMLGITEEEFPEQAAEMVKENIRQEFCIDAIAETESLLPTGEELAAAYDELAEKIGYEDGKTLVDEYGEYAVKYTVAHDLVMDFLYDNADIVETSPESEAEAAESEVESEAEAESESESEAESATSETESAESEAADSTAAESEAASEASNS